MQKTDDGFLYDVGFKISAEVKMDKEKKQAKLRKIFCMGCGEEMKFGKIIERHAIKVAVHKCPNCNSTQETPLKQEMRGRQVTIIFVEGSSKWKFGDAVIYEGYIGKNDTRHGGHHTCLF